ncbi:conserved Plasmodium protein, unknown function [Plasmodium malariae]|uniref:Uncharacterized protein n=1 Tax=Plasmodium malariae TaxID=5858 RepID=A0A1C3KF46_PLAMA|nr:conserved Plasmodium protein, unknown function [Plasmodium malariae]
MNGQYSSKPPTYTWDMNVGVNAIKENIVDFILLCGFSVSILGSFYFFYWLKNREMRNVCSRSY